MKRLLVVLLVSGCGASDFYAADDFSYSDEEWEVESEDSAPTMDLVKADVNGNAPYICGHDTGFSGSMFWRFRAPRKYLGNAGKAFHQRLTWETATDYPSGTLRSSADAFLVGRGVGLVLNVPNPPRAKKVWRQFSVFLDARSPWRKLDVDGFPLATDEEIESVLKTLSSVFLPGEWRDGEETSCIDNIYFGTP